MKGTQSSFQKAQQNKTYPIGIQYKLEKKEQSRDPQGHFEPTGRPVEKIAKQHNVSPATVKRAEKYADAVDQLPENNR
jgi:hypothetical protein